MVLIVPFTEGQVIVDAILLVLNPAELSVFSTDYVHMTNWISSVRRLIASARQTETAMIFSRIRTSRTVHIGRGFGVSNNILQQSELLISFIFQYNS